MVFVSDFIFFFEWWFGLRVDHLTSPVFLILDRFHLIWVQSFAACASDALDGLREHTLGIWIVLLLWLRRIRCRNLKVFSLRILTRLGSSSPIQSWKIISVIVRNNRLVLARQQGLLLLFIIHRRPPHSGSISGFGNFEILHVRTGNRFSLTELRLCSSRPLASWICGPFKILSNLNTFHLFNITFGEFWHLGSSVVNWYRRFGPLGSKHGSCHLVDGGSLIVLLPYDPKLVKRIMRSALVKAFEINMDHADSFFVVNICASVHCTRSCNRLTSALSYDFKFICFTDTDLI